MRMSLLRPFLATLVVFSVASCGDDSATPQTSTPVADQATNADTGTAEGTASTATTRRPATLSADVPEPAASSNRVIIGNSLAPDGAAMSGQNSFSTGDSVYVSAPLDGVPPGANVSVYWTYEDGNSHKEETVQAPAGEEYIVFEFSEADGMQPGTYNAQIDVNMQPVGIAEFRVE
ncbi:hypothetical protein [Novilysobacter spongiicola]|uniref:PKD domain-containing protein n=1 Tax=Lysobacter spongiicola DSM 21749 TaxID=1122188 RepID=A0A1T4PFW3_9GAMM|nr:hypothetical protein [Lysobacter spongiicola]SJZ90261.1 hypothetical protein SAMN02745674_01169 [Lysobacter spongiicola DSM 21749]